METVLPGGSSDPLSNAATEYNALSGGGTWTTTENNRKAPIPTDGILKSLRVNLSAAPTNNAYIFTVMKNGVPTDLAVTVAVGETTGSDTTHTVDLAPGDLVTIRSSYAAAPGNTPAAYWRTIFEGDDGGESIILGNQYRWTATTYYTGIQNGHTSTGMSSTDGFGRRNRMPTAGTLKKLYAYMTVNDTDTLAFTLYKNGVASDLSATIVSLVCTPDTTHTVDIADDDYVQLRLIASGAIGGGYVGWGMVWTPDTVGEFLLTVCSNDNPADATYNFPAAGSNIELFSATEADRQALTGLFRVTKMRAAVDVAPGAGASRTFTLRDDGSATSVAVALGAADTDKNWAGSVEVADGSLLSIVGNFTGAPAAIAGIQYSLVGVRTVQNQCLFVSTDGA